MSSELLKDFQACVEQRAKATQTQMEKMIEQYWLLSDVDLAALMWERIWDIRPGPNPDADEDFQNQVRLVRLMRILKMKGLL